MTPKEQHQVNAGMAFMGVQLANVAKSGAESQMAAEAYAIRVQELEAEVKALKEAAEKSAKKAPKKNKSSVPSG